MNDVKNIPEGWSFTTLNEVVDSANTGLDAIKRAPIVEEDTGIKCFRIQDASQRKEFNKWGNTKVEDRNFKKFKLIAGDILIARTGNSIGVNYLVRKNLKSVFNNGLIRLRVKNRIDYHFLYKIIESDKFERYVQSIAYGTSTQPNIQIKVLLGYEFLLPPLPEQKSIAAILTAFDDKIELLQAQNKTLEETAQTIFKEWFGNYQIEDELPQGWRVKRLGDVIDIKYGKDHKLLAEGQVPVYGSGGIMRFVDTYLYDKDSILIPRKGTLSNLFYVNFPFWSVDTMFYTIIKDLNQGRYIYLFLKSIDLSSMDVGSAVPSLTTQLLKQIPIIVPEEKIMQKFDSAVVALYNKMDKNNTQIQTLTQTRDALLPKLMSGEIRVNEVKD